MKTCILYPVTCTLILAAFLVMPIGIACANNESDDYGTLSSGSSSVFSPGYINAAKQKTEAIISQLDPSKSFMEKLVENIKNKMSGNVERAASTKVTAGVKKMTSARISAAQPTAATVSSDSPENILAYVRDQIREYIANNNDASKSTYELKQSNGKYYAFWVGESIMNVQVFDSNGNALNAEPINLTEDESSQATDTYSATVLANGNVAVIWRELDAENTLYVKAQTFDSKGSAIYAKPTSITNDDFKNASIEHISVFTNGNVSISWKSQTYDELEGRTRSYIKTQTFDSDGKATAAQTILTGNELTYEGSGIYSTNRLDNGNMVITWSQTDINLGKSIRTQTFDSYGNPLAPQTILTGDRLVGDLTIYGTPTLSNGNVAVMWMERSFETFRNEQGDQYYYSLRTQTFDSDGNATAPQTSLTGDRLLTGGVGVIKFSVLPNGDMVIFWIENNLIKARTFNSNGTAINDMISVSDDYSGSINVLTLPNGDVTVIWREISVLSDYRNFIKIQTFGSDGNAISAQTILTGDRFASSAIIYSASMLDNGNVAVIWSERDINGYVSVRTQIFDSNGNATTAQAVLTGDSSFLNAQIKKVFTLANGNVVIIWGEGPFVLKTQTFDSNGNATAPQIRLTSVNSSSWALHSASVLANGNVAMLWIEGAVFKTQTFDSYGNATAPQTTLTTKGSSINSFSVLANGNVAIVWSESTPGAGQYYNYSYYAIKTQIFDSSGNAITAQASLTRDRSVYGVTIQDVSVLANGNVIVFWRENGSSLSGMYSNYSQVIGSDNSFVSSNILRPSLTDTGIGNLRQDLFRDPYINSLKSDTLNSATYGFELRAVMSDKNVPNVFKALLSSENTLASGMGGALNEAAIGRLITQTLNSAIGIPGFTQAEGIMPEMQIALALANILKNPNEEQKLLIDAITSLLKDAAKIEGEAGKSEDLKKAENDLLQMAAAVLLVQGIPDLIKAGDMESIKGMFKDLGVSKGQILLDYTKSIGAYYNSIAKEIAANTGALTDAGIIKKKLTEEELKREPNRIEKILEDIRKANAKSFALEYILQQDSKYRKEYLDSSKKLMEDQMKNMLGSFAKKLNEALEAKK